MTGLWIPRSFDFAQDRFHGNNRKSEARYEIRNTRYELEVSFDEAGVDFVFDK